MNKKCVYNKSRLEVMHMMYPFITFTDGTEVVHSHLIEENGKNR